jgi:transposase-like protein
MRSSVKGRYGIVLETGKPIARDLDINPGALCNWVTGERAECEAGQGYPSHGAAAELKRVRAENGALWMERDVLKRSVVVWVGRRRSGDIVKSCGLALRLPRQVEPFRV